MGRSLHAYVSDLALGVMTAAPASGRAEVDGSLAFFDISGFTKLTERLARLGRSGAEHINDVLNTVFQGLIDEVFRHGGDVLEFGGDAMVVLFTGDGHERRAAAAAADMFRFIAAEGRIVTPAGDARLRMSCGIASGPQAYYLLGKTRRALVVAGPVSTAMARLEASAGAGEALIDTRLDAGLPRGWTGRVNGSETLRLRLGQVIADDRSLEVVSRQFPEDAETLTARLLPTQFGSLLDVTHRAGELKQVAMSFIRLNGTDDVLASEGVESVHRLLAEITEIVDRAASELDVCWLETQAEANSVRWTLIAGAPTATERDGERLLRVLRRIADESPVPLRIGANLGVVFVGDMGHTERCTYIVMGDATNLAARLMTKAEPGEIIAGERLHDTCPGRFEWTPLEPFLVKGKRAPVQAYLVGDVTSGDESGAGHSDGVESPMVGRDEELATLLQAISDGGAVELVGEAGVGKSRLWQEARRVEDQRSWFVMRAEPHEVGSPYLPFGRLIRRAAGTDPRADDAAVGLSITNLVERCAPNLVPWIPLVADLVGASVPTTDEVEALDPTFRADRLRAVVAELVLEWTGRGAVIVFEDVHWIDESSRSLVEVLVGLRGDGSSIVLTRRAEGWSPSPVTTIELAAIDGKAAEQLVLRELPASAASDATLSRLMTSAAGNPLYLIELARSIANSTARSNVQFPETVERVLAARIDQLPIRGRELIRDASVLGATMSRDLAARVLDRQDLADAGTWERELGDLVVVDNDTARFRHDLVRVAAYEGLSVRRRREVHRRAGDVIEAWGDSVPIADALSALAFHATGSGLPERVIRWNSEAAEAAIDKGAMEIAESLLRDVVAAQRQVAAGPAECCSVQRRLAYAAERAGHPESAVEALGHAARLADAKERALIAVDRARLLEKQGRYRAALTTTAHALRKCTDPNASAHLRLARASIRNYMGQWSECLRLSLALLDDCADSDDRSLLAQAHLLAEWSCDNLGSADRALHERAALELLTELDDSIGLANLLLNRGVSAWRECRAVDAVADFRASSERYVRAGDVLGAAIVDNNLAEILTLQSQLEEAEQLLIRARRLLHAANYPLGKFAAISGLSRIDSWRGQPNDALRLQSEALEGFRELRADDYVVDSLVRLVEIHVVAGDAVRALEAAADARVALTKLGPVPVVPATLARLTATALLLLGRTSEARDALDAALVLATGDGFAYEIALSSIALGRMDDDDTRVTVAFRQLAELGVLSAPPGSLID